MARPKMVNTGLVFAEVTINVGNIAAATVLEVTQAVKGIRLGYPVLVWCSTLEANLLMGGAYASAQDEVKFRIVNPTAAPIDPAAHSYYFVQF